MDTDRDAVERLEDRLYSRTAQTGVRPRTTLSDGPQEKPHGWKPGGETPPTPSEYPQRRGSLMPLFLGALIFFVAAVSYAAYTFFYGGNIVSSSNINLTILGPSMIDGGKEASFDISIENRNASALELVDLLVEYPDGTRSAQDVKVSLPRERVSIGTIDSGSRSKQTVRAVLFGEEGSTKHIMATLEYRVAGSNAIFTKEGGIDVLIGASPVAISIEGPDEAVSGQPIEFTVHIRSNAQVPVKNLAFEAQYPFGFSVTDASPETSVGDSLWRLGDLDPGKEKTIHIEGTIEGQDNDERVFRFLAGSEEDQTEAHIAVPYLTVPHLLSIQRPFISAELTLNGQSGQTVVVTPGKEVKGVISWKNNLDTEVQDLQITAALTGQALDKSSVTASRGFYRSLDSTLIWSKNDDTTFASVAPGASGTVEFSFTPKASSGSSVLVNPEIGIAVSVGAKRTGGGNVPEIINSAFTRIVRVGSALAADARTRHFSGPISNQGPMPPRVDQETTYTLVWTIQNPSNTISNTKASATLPSYVRFVGQVTPATERLTYNAQSNTVSWALGDIKAGTGYSTAPREVSFQVALTPSLTQIGSIPTLTGALFVTGDDRFTGARVEASADAPTTKVDFSEAGFVSGMENVQAQ